MKARNTSTSAPPAIAPHPLERISTGDKPARAMQRTKLPSAADIREPASRGRALGSIAPVRAARTGAKARLDAAIDAYVTALLRDAPEWATSLGVTETRAGGPFNDRLADASRAGMERSAASSRALLARLTTVDRGRLTPADQVTYDIAETIAQTACDGVTFGYGTYGAGTVQPYVVTQLSGSYASLPGFLANQHPLKSTRDTRDFLTRLSQLAGVFDQETTLINEDAARGIVPPRFIIDRTLAQLSILAEESPADTRLVQGLRSRAAAIPGLDVEALASQATAIVRDAVLPALRRQVAALKAAREHATDDAGVWRLPRGDELYRAALRGWTNTDLAPDAIHELGVAIVETTRGELDTLLRNQGLTEGPIAERLTQLVARPDLTYPNTEAGKTHLLADLNGLVADMRRRMADWFGELPKAELEIKRVPLETEGGASAGYYQPPAIDGSRPGTYYINLRDTRDVPKTQLPSITYHEGVPGHHAQIAITQESGALPFLRSSLLPGAFAGYTEGWALYAEQLAGEMGVYDKNPLGRIGYLQLVALRAARLVVDTGLHVKRWTRDQAIDYMMSVTGKSRAFVTTEVERFCVRPGQATAYLVGREVINRLREHAKAELGADFDIKAFHDVILTNGNVPLSLIERSVNAWIATRKSRHLAAGIR